MSPEQWKVYHAFREVFNNINIRIATEDHLDYILVVIYAESFSYISFRDRVYTSCDEFIDIGSRRIDVPYQRLHYRVSKIEIEYSMRWVCEEIAKEAKIKWDLGPV